MITAAKMLNDQSARTAEQLDVGVTSAVGAADSGAAQTALNLQWIYQARLSQQKRTAATLKRAYGDGDAAVKDAQAVVDASTIRVARVAAIHRQVATPAPDVDANGWALHGRVFDAELQPVVRLTVFLVDADKTFQQQFGFAYTDGSGYFLINVAGGKEAAADVPPLYVEIADARGKPIYLGADVFVPTIGSAIYLNIALAEGREPIGEPPAAIRNTALPKTKRK